MQSWLYMFVCFDFNFCVDLCVSAESLTCNKCTFGLVGICLNSDTEQCSSNSSVCFTGKATFPSLSDFVGFNTQGCRDDATGCNMTTNATLLSVTYTTAVECCSTDQCNPVTLSGAPSTRMTLTAAVGAAVLASVWGSLL
uniref:UPAR/Ly6 domain-containing protein n=1 Tax=Echeneis naucrates TaxID=173247 RepID=A0A665VKC8_ECHNA